MAVKQSWTAADDEAPRIVDLGCGNNPREDAFGVDIRDYPNTDLQCDIRDLPDHWEGGVERAYASQVLEHLSGEAIAEALEEISRVLKPGGEFVFDVPHGRAHDADPTHETRWYFKTVAYYLPRREVARLGWDSETFPDYYADYDIDLELADRDAKAWLDLQSAPGRATSFAVRQISQTVTTDKWDGMPLIGGLAAGNLVFRLRKPTGDSR